MCCLFTIKCDFVVEAARRRCCGHMDKYFTSLSPRRPPYFVHTQGEAGLMFDDTLMAEVVQMFRPNRDKWEPFVACCRVNMVVQPSYLEKLPAERRRLADFRLLRGNSHNKQQLASFLRLYSDSAVSRHSDSHNSFRSPEGTMRHTCACVHSSPLGTAFSISHVIDSHAAALQTCRMIKANKN